MAPDHRVTTQEMGEGRVQAVCSCGCLGPIFGGDQTTGTMEPLQQALDAGGLHDWEMSLR